MTVTWIRAKLQPTEDPEKVAQAIRKIFGEIELETKQGVVSARLEGVETLSGLRGRIAQDRIRDTVKTMLTRWAEGDVLSFGLNRQAAYAGHVSLNLRGEDPMGPIQVRVEGDVQSVISFLCEKMTSR
ncbi:hypothetical protein KAV47_02305 [Candidatus Bathyarchaeota archaeon]|nr:hypothetical protein [Candidatus Bathyarchaeota archaeon]